MSGSCYAESATTEVHTKCVAYASSTCVPLICSHCIHQCDLVQPRCSNYNIHQRDLLQLRCAVKLAYIKTPSICNRLCPSNDTLFHCIIQQALLEMLVSARHTTTQIFTDRVEDEDNRTDEDARHN